MIQPLTCEVDYGEAVCFTQALSAIRQVKTNNVSMPEFFCDIEKYIK